MSFWDGHFYCGGGLRVGEGGLRLRAIFPSFFEGVLGDKRGEEVGKSGYATSCVSSCEFSFVIVLYQFLYRSIFL